MNRRSLAFVSILTAAFLMGASSCTSQRVKVIEGSGGGLYKPGDVVEIEAREAAINERFDLWEGDTEYLDDPLSSTTLLRVPDEKVEGSIIVEAKFEILDLPQYILEVISGSGSGNYFEGEEVEISANPADEGYEFENWEVNASDLGENFDATSSTTTLLMPGSDLRLEAYYSGVYVPPPPSNPTVPEDFANITWLHTNVSGWAQTGTLHSVSISGNLIYLNYDKAGVWPIDNGVVANPWIFIQKDDGSGWHAATWEWMRPNQTAKLKRAVNGDHIKRDPLKDFVPQSGEWYGFMLSGLARDHRRNAIERTNVVMFQWP